MIQSLVTIRSRYAFGVLTGALLWAALGTGRPGTAHAQTDSQAPTQSDPQAHADAESSLETGALLAVVSGADVPSRDMDAGVRAAVLASLDRLGYRTLSPAQVRTRLGTTGSPDLCEVVSDCDYSALARAVRAQGVVVYSLFVLDGQPHEFAVAVMHGDRRGDASYRLSPDESLAAVVPKLLYRALARLGHTGRVRLRVKTEPAGAEIEVDRRLTGSAPAEFWVAPGQHEIRARAPGRIAVLDYVDVEEGDEPVVTLTLPQAVQVEVSSYGALRDRSPSHTVDYVLGGLLGAAAVAGVVYGVLTLDDSGKCFTHDDVAPPSGRRCALVTSPPPLTIAAFAGAGVLATGSVLMFVLTPFTDDGGDSAGLRLTGRF